MCISLLLGSVVSAGAQGGTKREDIAKLLSFEEREERASLAVEMIIEIGYPGTPKSVQSRVKREHITNMLQSISDLYDRYYTHDEIKRLLSFYESDRPLGASLESKSSDPSLMQELATIAIKWGEVVDEKLAPWAE
jgi:hypothetical protein